MLVGFSCETNFWSSFALNIFLMGSLSRGLTPLLEVSKSYGFGLTHFFTSKIFGPSSKTRYQKLDPTTQKQGPVVLPCLSNAAVQTWQRRSMQQCRPGNVAACNNADLAMLQ
jgi:hypothetical protein